MNYGQSNYSGPTLLSEAIISDEARILIASVISGRPSVNVPPAERALKHMGNLASERGRQTYAQAHKIELEAREIMPPQDLVAQGIASDLPVTSRLPRNMPPLSSDLLGSEEQNSRFIDPRVYQGSFGNHQ